MSKKYKSKLLTLFPELSEDSVELDSGAIYVGLWNDHVIAPGVKYLGPDGKIKKMRENSITEDILDGIGYEFDPNKEEVSESEIIELVPISSLTEEQRRQLPLEVQHIYFGTLVDTAEMTASYERIAATRGFFYDKEISDFFYKDNNFYFKGQIQEVIKNDEDAAIFEKAYDWIKDIALQSSDKFDFGTDLIVDKYLDLLGASKEKSLLKNHFDNYFASESMFKEIRDATSVSKEEMVDMYEQIVDKLYSSLTKERLKNTFSNKILEKVNSKIDFTILDYLMKDAGIAEKDLKTSDFSYKLQNYLSNPSNKGKLRDIFLGDVGKQMVLNSIFEMFLANPTAKTLSFNRTCILFWIYSRTTL